MGSRVLSPLDGRYLDMVEGVGEHLSEFAIFKNMIKVEICWLLKLVELGITPVKSLRKESKEILLGIECNFEKIKSLEKQTRHDTKAVEYYIKSCIQESGDEELLKLCHWIHMFCTSDDIKNTAYSMGLKSSVEDIIKPLMMQIVQVLTRLSVENAHIPLLAKTHGQPATPTTVGKEFAVYAARLGRQYLKYFEKVEYFAKFGGAVGNFNAHVFAFPEIEWPAVARQFIQDLGLTYQEYSTQIECHDFISEVSDSLARFNTILRDLCVDVWLYISRGIFKLALVPGEVGSSTMPHKINPIRMECAEGNIGIANSILRFFSDKLPNSRLQRDLCDSTVLRNLGIALGHSIVAMKMVIQELTIITVDVEVTDQELNDNWVVLSEAIQTSLKVAGDFDAFEEILKETRGAKISAQDMQRMLKEKSRYSYSLETLTPRSYIGLANVLAKNLEHYHQTLK
ncbi:bifunctional L-Aspartase-like/Adenylosuccinate lyase PurB [Babesia duncani]|uniref:Bifunctional L-Aspartase-like/Adenylosuccinate lyase PurB n=1 Tax=Babesia duncani TaxID=323732 RepID=A0AAD9PJB3_9APIC|nr:bifunctional L-Aspartase-like/Adenylosuccinate lyase PurB [Babesia duncani]